MTATNTPLGNRAARLEAEIAAIRKVQATLGTLRETLNEFPELLDAFADEIRVIAGGGGGTENGTCGPSGATATLGAKLADDFRKGTNFDRVRTFLESVGNKAQTVAAMCKATGIPEASIRHAISTGYKARFIMEELPGNPLKHWRLRTDKDGGQVTLTDVVAMDEP